MKILARIFAWLLLLGSAVVSSVGAIWVDSSGQSQSLLLVTRGSGSLANWLFFFLTLSLSSCVYLLRGIEARVWSIGLHGVVMVLGLATILLTTGVVGLAGFAVVGTIVGKRWAERRRGASGI